MGGKLELEGLKYGFNEGMVGRDELGLGNGLFPSIALNAKAEVLFLLIHSQASF